jgi:hypothetical protein
VCTDCRRVFRDGEVRHTHDNALPCGHSFRLMALQAITVWLWRMFKHDTWTGRSDVVWGSGGQPWTGSEREAQAHAATLPMRDWNGRHRWSYFWQPVDPERLRKFFVEKQGQPGRSVMRGCV